MTSQRSLFGIALIALFGLVACGGDPPPPAPVTVVPEQKIQAPPAIPIPPPPKFSSRGFVLMDFASGQTLAAEQENTRLEPASLTKLMTAYAVFDALRAGSLKLTDQITISEHAWRVGGAGSTGSTSFLPINSQAPVEVLLRGMIVQSGNDASIALAERVAGSEDAFAQLLNGYAKRLGMTGTNFENSTGLPGANHYTTPHDMALLAAAIVRDFPQYYHYYAEKQYTFNGITQQNRNGLLYRDPSVDGLKTGHTESAGYCLVSSAKRGEQRMIAVVMGTASMKAREEASMALLNYGFNFYQAHPLITAGQSFGEVRVWRGKENQTSAIAKNALVVTVPRGRAQDVQTQVELPPSVIAPLVENQAIGKVNAVLDGKVIATQPLYAQTAVPEAGFFGRMTDSLRMKFE